VVAREPVTAPGVESTVDDRSARAAHERDQEMYIVQRYEAQPEDLVGDEEMPDVGAGEAFARGALARLVQWPRVCLELGAAHVDATAGGKCGAVSTHSRRRYAVEHVDASANPLHEILRKSDTHEITGPVGRQLIVHDVEHGVHVGLRLADGEPANAVAWPVAFRLDCAGCFSSYDRVDTPLDNGEKGLLGRLAVPEPFKLGPTTPQPSHTPLARIASLDFG